MRLTTGLLVLAILVPVAAGHTGLAQTTPADGASLEAAPFNLSLRFAEPIISVERVVVLGPSGSDLQRGAKRDPRDAARVAVDVGPDAGGAYRVEWAVLSADGHTIAGRYAFEAKRGSVARPLAVIGRSLDMAANALRASEPAEQQVRK